MNLDYFCEHSTAASGLEDQASVMVLLFKLLRIHSSYLEIFVKKFSAKVQIQGSDTFLTPTWCKQA